MHALPAHPKNPLVLGLLVLALALLVLAAAAPDLGTLEFSLGSGSGSETSSGTSAAPTAPQGTTPAEPTWVTDPLASPLQQLAAPR